MADITLSINPMLYVEPEAVPVENKVLFPNNLPRELAKFDGDAYRNLEVVRQIRITVTVGTFYFNVNGSPVITPVGGIGSGAVTTTDTPLFISLKDGDELYFKAVTQNDAFRIDG